MLLLYVVEAFASLASRGVETIRSSDYSVLGHLYHLYLFLFFDHKHRNPQNVDPFVPK
jgi:hypothetical protein